MHVIIGSILEDIDDKHFITGSILEDVIDKYLIIGSILDDTNDPKTHYRQFSVTFSILLPVFIAVTRNTFPVRHFWISIIVICTLVAPGSSIFIITFTNWFVVNFVKVASVSEWMSRGFGVWTGTSLARYVIWWRGGTIKTFPANRKLVLNDNYFSFDQKIPELEAALQAKINNFKYQATSQFEGLVNFDLLLFCKQKQARQWHKGGLTTGCLLID